MILKGITQEAYDSLSPMDIKSLKDMIGMEVEYSLTEEEMLIMPDGELTHESFLILEKYQKVNKIP